MGPWVQGLCGTYSTFTPIIAEQKCVYGPVWGDPVPPNCRVLKADGHFTVARTLYYPYHELRVPGSKEQKCYVVRIAHFTPIIELRVPGSKGYVVHIALLHP